MEVQTKFRDETARRAMQSLKALVLRSTALLDLQGFWAITDQGVVSLGNFLTTIVLARSITPELYGVWTVLFGLMLFLNVVHSSLIVYPITVITAGSDANESRNKVSSALVFSALMSVPLGLAVVGAASFIGATQLGLWAWLALLCWQLQETTRRALMARFSCRKAVMGDGISYLCQAGIIWWLSQTGALTIERAFAAIAITCSLAALVQSWQLRSEIGLPHGCTNLIKRFWRTGHWMLWSELTTNLGFQAAPWVLFLMRGAGAAAGYQAISNLLGLTHPVMLSLGNVIVPEAARARAQKGLRAARRVAMVHATQGGVILLVCFGVLIAFPKQLLGLLYGSSSTYLNLDQDIRLFAVAYFLFFIALALKFLLNALQETRKQLFAELGCCALLLLTIVPLVTAFGLAGAISALGIWFLARVILGAVILRQVAPPGEATDPEVNS